MTDDTKDPNAEVAAQNQAAADSATASAPGAATDPNVSGSGLADVLAGATDRLAAVSTAGASDPNSNAAVSTSSATSTLSGSMASGNVAAAKADSDFINNPASQQPSTAGTSGKQGVDTGMALDAGTEKLTPEAAAQAGGNASVDAPNVNVRAPGAVHPVVYTIQQRAIELKLLLQTQEKTPWMQRALKDLQTMEEWVVQHFEELKRKL